MPCHYVIDKEHRLVIATGVGEVTFAEMKEFQDRLRNDPDFDPEFNQLIDATGVVKVELSRDAAQILTSRNIFSPVSRRALVAHKPAVFGVGRMLMTYFELAIRPSQTNAFYEFAPALEWLGVEGMALPGKDQSAKGGA